MVDHFSELTYVLLTRSTLQEETYKENQPLKYGIPDLELKFTYTMNKIEYFLNNLSDQQLWIPTKQ